MTVLAAALIAAAFYLLLSGAEVATQRSFFMTAVVLIAVSLILPTNQVIIAVVAVAAWYVFQVYRANKPARPASLDTSVYPAVEKRSEARIN